MKTIFITFGFLFVFPGAAYAAGDPAQLGDVVINEIAWMGTENSYNDEWIELYNNTNSGIDLTGWGIYENGGETLIEPLEGVIGAGAYYLIERTDDTTVPEIAASQEPTSWGGNGLKNSGEHLALINQEAIIDEINAADEWPAGDNSTKQTMERKNPKLSGSDPDSFATSVKTGGTPKAQNSVYEPETSYDDTSASGEQSDSEENEQKQDPNSPTNKSRQQTDGSSTSEPDATTTPSQHKTEPKDESKSATTTDSEGEPQQQTAYPDGIFINEIMPSPKGRDSEQEWIELINTNDERVDISSWKIRDISGATNTYIFPEGTSLEAGTFLVLSRPTTKITLNNDGDGLELVKPDEKIVQTVQYNKAPKGNSYARSAEEWKWSDVPTPGSTNIISQISIKTPNENINKKQAKTSTKTTNTNQSANPPTGGHESQTRESSEISGEKHVASVGSTMKLGENPQNNNLLTYTLAPLLALLSALFIFILKKRLQRT